MDVYEATELVFTKIKNFDPENSSKIAGYILIQDGGEEYMTRLALAPESVLHSLVHKIKHRLGLSPNISPTPSSPSPFNPISRSTINNRLSQSSPRIPNNGLEISKNPHSSSSIDSWQLSGFPNSSSTRPISYDSFRGGSSPFVHKENDNADDTTSAKIVDTEQVNDYIPFRNDMSSSSRNDNLVEPPVDLGPKVRNEASSVNNGESTDHKRSYSTNEMCFGSKDEGLSIRYNPCVYFARGFCKKGSNCKFLHGGFADSVDASARAQTEEQRMAAASQHSKCKSHLPQQQHDYHRTAAAVVIGEETHKFGQFGNERHDALSSRQIFLTFAAESTFTYEDVSEYFSKFGPVQEVTIPYQQKRTFGFVTFVLPETVKLILRKANNHYIRNSRVNVKPHKGHGTVPDRSQQCQLLPSESRDPFGVNLGHRSVYNAQELLSNRKLDTQIGLLRILDCINQQPNNQYFPINQNDFPPYFNTQQVSGDHGDVQAANISITLQQQLQQQLNPLATEANDMQRNEEENSSSEEHSLEHLLPADPFGSPI